MKKVILLVLIALASTIVTAGVRMALEYNIHPLPAFIAKEAGIFAKNGIDITDFKVYKTGLQITSALVRGDADVAIICLSPAILAYERGAKIKTLALTHLYGYGVVASQELEEVYNWENKTIATMKPGSPLDLLFQIAKEKYHIQNTDVRRLAPLDMLIALERGDVKVAFLSEPFATMAELRGFKYIVTSEELWPGMNGSVLVASEEFLSKHPEESKKLVNSLKEAISFIYEDPRSSAEYALKYISTSPEAVVRAIEMKRIIYTAEVDSKQLEKTIHLMESLGYIKPGLKAGELLAPECPVK